MPTSTTQISRYVVFRRWCGRDSLVLCIPRYTVPFVLLYLSYSVSVVVRSYLVRAVVDHGEWRGNEAV